MDMSPLEIFDDFVMLRFYAVDTPLDRRVDMESALSVSIINRVEFVSEDEITALKQEQRNSILGIADVEENSYPQEDAANE